MSMSSFEERVEQMRTPSLEKGTFYWIRAVDERGRTVVHGPHSSEQEAYSFGYEKLDGNFSVIPIKTRDLASATRRIKAMKLDETGDLTASIQRARHKI